MSCGNPHRTDCRQILDRVYEFLDGEMAPGDEEAFREHLDECGPCLAEYGLDQALKALVRRSCRCESAPEDLRIRIKVKISEVRLGLSDSA